jgi:putative glutamine amidotransferase
MIVLVSMRTADNPTYVERRDAISHDWSSLFGRLGIVPLLVPNALGDVTPYFRFGASGLLLTGGDDLGPPGEPTLRDRTEMELVEGALARRMPIFAACRGLHVINRHFGGTVATTLPEKHVGEHDVRLDDGQVRRINSFHNQGVLESGLAPVLAPFAATAAGVIEAARHRQLPIIAVQWHPERPNPAASLDGELLRQWMAQCA